MPCFYLNLCTLAPVAACEIATERPRGASILGTCDLVLDRDGARTTPGRGNYGERRESPGGPRPRHARARGAAEPGVTVTRGAWDRETRND